MPKELKKQFIAPIGVSNLVYQLKITLETLNLQYGEEFRSAETAPYMNYIL